MMLKNDRKMSKYSTYVAIIKHKKSERTHLQLEAIRKANAKVGGYAPGIFCEALFLILVTMLEYLFESSLLMKSIARIASVTSCTPTPWLAFT